MNLISKSREELEELAKECGLTVTFDNPPEKCGIQYLNVDGTVAEFIHFDDVFDKIFKPVFGIADDDLTKVED